MAKSIMQCEKECYVTGSTYDLHRHHVFFMGWQTERKAKNGAVGSG